MEDYVGDKFLPVGTVVLLKDSKKRFMITGFCSMDKNANERKIYDYSGCLFPEGMMSNQTALFDHEQISKVFHLGLSDDEEKTFKVKLNDILNSSNNLTFGTVENLVFSNNSSFENKLNQKEDNVLLNESEVNAAEEVPSEEDVIPVETVTSIETEPNAVEKIPSEKEANSVETVTSIETEPNAVEKIPSEEESSSVETVTSTETEPNEVENIPSEEEVIPVEIVNSTAIEPNVVEESVASNINQEKLGDGNHFAQVTIPNATATPLAPNPLEALNNSSVQSSSGVLAPSPLDKLNKEVPNLMSNPNDNVVEAPIQFNFSNSVAPNLMKKQEEDDLDSNVSSKNRFLSNFDA